MAILLPFNIVLACTDFYELKVSLIGSIVQTEYLYELFINKYIFLIIILIYSISVDGRLFSSEYLPICAIILIVFWLTIFHSVWGSIYTDWSINNMGICDIGHLVDFGAHICKFWRLYGLLDSILYPDDRRMVCRSCPRLLLSRECKATWQLHWYFLDKSRVGWHL